MVDNGVVFNCSLHECVSHSQCWWTPMDCLSTASVFLPQYWAVCFLL